MRGLSIAVGLRLALIGLTLALVLIAALGVASLYGARVSYEAALFETYELDASAARLVAAGVVEQAAALAGSPATKASRRRAVGAFNREARLARDVARSDPESAALVANRVRAQERLRHLAERRRDSLFTRLKRAAVTGRARRVGDALAARQDERRKAAAELATGDTRRAAATIVIAALLALLAALVLVRDLVRRIRRPLDELVGATRRLAAGDLSQRATSSGPSELHALSDAFNAMAADLREARERLEQERRKLEVTIESLGDGLVVCDDGRRLTAFNPRAAELVPDLRVGQRLGAADGPLPRLEEALEGEAAVERNGRTLAVTAAPLEPGGGGSVWTIRDISERARLERMKSDFVAAASHELRSPLTSIKGFVELLGRSEGLTDRQHESVEVIRISTDRLVDLVEDLLEVARIDAGRVAVEPRPIDVTEVVRQVTALMGPRFAEKRQHVEARCPAGLPAACADSRRVQEIVENLLTNAHLYTGDGGRIEVVCGADERAVTIEVSDTGRGMSPEEIEHAFDRFYRGSEETALTPGTGLGLWIVRSLAELQDGSVTVESEPGAGSRFTVELPRATPDAAVGAGDGVAVAPDGYNSG